MALDTKTAKQNTYMMKYIRFCLANHRSDSPLLPMADCFNLGNLMLFTRWASLNGIDGGWGSVSNYVGEVCKAFAQREVPDPRVASTQAVFWWDRFRKIFKKKVLTKRKIKLKLQPAHHQAIAEDLDVAHAGDRAEAALYAALMFLSCRVGHMSPAKMTDLSKVLRFCDCKFMPSFDEPERLFVLLRCTKTRGENEGRPTWQAVARLHDMDGIDTDTMCPVLTVRNHFAHAYAGDAEAPLFTSHKDPSKPLGRNEFTTRLKARLRLASRHLSAPVNTDNFSGISFRKGGLSALAGQVATNHLADHADHKDISSTREYTSQTVEDRSEHAVFIARRYSDKAVPRWAASC